MEPNAVFSEEHKDDALRLVGFAFEQYLEAFYKALKDMEQEHARLMQQEQAKHPGMEFNFQRFGHGTFFEVASYLLFRLDWTMHNEKRKTEERKDILASCENLVIRKLRSQYNATDEEFRSAFENRYEIYARDIMATKALVEASNAALFRFQQLMLRFTDSDTLEKEEIPAPIYVNGMFVIAPFKKALGIADEEFGVGFEFMWRHVFHCCSDIRQAAPHLLNLLLLSGKVYAEELIESTRKDNQAPQGEL